jgi:plasmid stabilization system protein ParE
MAFRVEVTPKARRDADEILNWLLSRNAGEPGLLWFRGLEAAILSLSNLPERCKLAPERASVPFEMRQLVYGGKPHEFRILFTIASETVYVLRIRRGRRERIDKLRH